MFSSLNFQLVSRRTIVLAAVFAIPLAPVVSYGQASGSGNEAAPPASAEVKAAESLLQRGETEKAVADLLALRAQSPEPPGTERALGSHYYAVGDMTRADEAYTRALQQDPQDHEATEMRGMVLYRTGRPTDAIPYLEKANGWLPGINTDANYVLALCYMKTEQYDKARVSLAAVYGFAPDSAEAYLLASRLLLRQEFAPVAQQFATKALQLKPGLPRAHEILGEIALSQQDMDQAISEFQQELKIDPLSASVYDRLGDAYVRLGKYDEAQRVLNRSILLDPYSSGPLILLGKTLLRRNEAAMASSFLSRAVHMDPGNYMAHNLLGQAYRALGKTEEASREMQMAEKLQVVSTPNSQEKK